MKEEDRPPLFLLHNLVIRAFAKGDDDPGSRFRGGLNLERLQGSKTSIWPQVKHYPGSLQLSLRS